MQYLCLAFQDNAKLDALSQSELEALVDATVAWIEELEHGGHHVLSAALQAPSTAMTVRQRSGTLSFTDGPFAETAEILGGFVLITARDLNEAIQLASKFPVARLGSVEVRPVLEADGVLTDSLDQKIGAAFRRSAQRFDPVATARIASVGQRRLENGS